MIRIKSQLNQLVLFSTALLFLGIFNSCQKEPDGLGLELIPGQENLLIKVDSSSVVLATTVKLDPMVSYQYDSTKFYFNDQLLGNYTNNVFGSTYSSLLINFYPGKFKPGFSSSYRGDSLVFITKIDTLYGNKESNIEIRIWELSKAISDTSKYYSNINIENYRGNLVATKTVKYNDTLRVKLDNALASRLLSVPDIVDSTSARYAKFYEYFKGLYVEISILSPEGGYVVMDPWRNSSSGTSQSPRLILHYNNGSKDTSFNYYTQMAFNKISHNYSGSSVETALQNSELGQKITYVQGLGGVATQLNISSLSKWLEIAPVSINKAELVIPVALDVIPESLIPKQLFIKAIKSGIRDLDFIEYGLGQSFLNGVYDSSRKAYIFNLAKHIQKIANSKFGLAPIVQNTDLVIMADGYKVGQPNFYGNAGLNFSGARLYIVYSKQ